MLLNLTGFKNLSDLVFYRHYQANGQTDYLTFCNHAAQCGIAKWSVDIIDMTCTYLNTSDDAILIEKIPS